MPAVYIDTMDQFLAWRRTLEPVYINSRTHGRILVPCANTILVRASLVAANRWNPNTVPPDRMRLLQESIVDNGFCFPVVTVWDDERELFIVCDGFHRTTIGGVEWLDLDYIPLAVLSHDVTKAMIATMQFNRARGMHQVDLDADVVRALVEQGLTEDEIATKLGMELDAVRRYKQLTGVAELFKNAEYSLAWEMVDDEKEG